jgi:hypothetical protein
VAAGQAGSNVRGAAEEQAIGSITKAPVIAATGGSLGPLRAAGNLIYDLYSLKKYDLLSKVLSRSGGATGFRNRAAQLSRLQQLTEGQPATQVIRMLNDYAEGKPLQ